MDELVRVKIVGGPYDGKTMVIDYYTSLLPIIKLPYPTNYGPLITVVNGNIHNTIEYITRDYRRTLVYKDGNTSIEYHLIQ